MNKTMKAVIIREHGGLDQLLYEDVPMPQFGPDDALIKVKAAALNHMDLWIRGGLPEGPGIRSVTLPHVSGGDIVGIVAAVGDNVQGITSGTPVVVYPGLYCGRCTYCLRGEHSMCTRYEVLGEKLWGGFAEYTCVPARNLEPLPEGLAFEQAAAVPVAFTTAWRMLMTSARLQPGEDVLILGVGGGVSSAALQIATRLGARVFVTSGHDWKLQRAKALGAEAGFNYNEGSFEEWLVEMTAGKGVEVVVDSTGAKTWPASIRSLSQGGRLVICGAATGDRPDISIREIYQNHRRILGAPLGNQEEFRKVLKLVGLGKLDPVIHEVFPLEEIQKGHQILESGAQFGKIVFQVENISVS